MKFFCLLSCLWCFTIACSALPQVQPASGAAREEVPRKCLSLFPKGKWQFVHSIEATMPEGQKGLVIGVTVISSRDKIAQSVIMTIEGLVIFDARYDRQLVVNRAVVPFDTEGFADGLLKDIQLIFFTPEGSLVESGYLSSGASVCRYQNPDGSIVDLAIHADHRWRISQYSEQHRVSRTVDAFFTKQDPGSDHTKFPDRLELKAHGFPGYALVMDLVEAVPLIP
ncbi:hypothetical protein ACFL9U_02290 [Thermodesulfobacteriota bacterium]